MDFHAKKNPWKHDFNIIWYIICRVKEKKGNIKPHVATNKYPVELLQKYLNNNIGKLHCWQPF